MRTRHKAGAALLLGILALCFAASGAAHAQSAPSTPPAQTFVPPPPLGRAFHESSGPELLSSSQGPLFDEQLGITYQTAFTSIGYNVTAVAQTDKSTGYGPAYLVNGLSNAGYWYQIGLSYDWPYIGTGYYPGFGANFEVFNSDGQSIFPSEGGGLLNFSGPVNPGDVVSLSLFFTHGNVTMQAVDLDTHSSAATTFSAEGADVFVGLSGGPANPDGFFTGLMTEWYHPTVYKSNPMETTYTSAAGQPSGLMWMDEFNANASKIVFSVVQQTPTTYTDPNHLVSLSADGALLYSDSHEFITGGLLGVTTTVVVKPGLDTPSVSAGNGFLISYDVNGTPASSFDTGNLTVTSDAGSEITISGVSTDSNTTTRWALNSEGTTLTFDPGSPISLTYHLQYILEVEGTAAGSSWWDNGALAQVSTPGVFGRANGTGYRIDSYSIDGAQATQIEPTAGTVSVNLTMSSPRTLDFETVAQYEVNLGGVPASVLATITPPTIAGDGHWYDGGTNVVVGLNGVWDRAGGSGDSLTSYSVSGGAQIPVATTGVVDAVDGPIEGPISVDATTTLQYQLTISGSLASVTPPPIPGDAGWYDSGARVSASFNYSWNAVANQSRLNAVGYAVDGNETITLQRRGGGAFLVSVAMTAPQRILVFSTEQYFLEISSPFIVNAVPGSPTNDSYYDAGSNVSLSVPYIVSVAPGARFLLTEFSVSNFSGPFLTAASLNGTGVYQPPRIGIDGPKLASFSYAKEYLVRFDAVDASGAGITPRSIEITEASGAGKALNATVQGAQIWLDNGTSLRVLGILWEGENVAPEPQPFQVSSPLNLTLRAQVYQAVLRVVDYFGMPVSGSQVTATIANGTVEHLTTNGTGYAYLGEIPLGTFSASVSSPLGTTEFSGNAAAGPLTFKIFGSTFTLAVIAVLAAAGVLAVAIAIRRVQSKPPTPSSPH